jgi:hypothetical protein
MINHMAMTSKIRNLPPALRAELDRRIEADSYGTVKDLRAWLSSENEAYSHSSIARYVLRKQRQRAGDGSPASLPELLRRLEEIVTELRDRFGR